MNTGNLHYPYAFCSCLYLKPPDLTLERRYQKITTKSQGLKQIDKLLLLTVIVLILASCVTQKRKGEVSTLGKLYHNVTAKYNGYFNADELLEASLLSLEEQYQDNFKQVLPVYEHVAAPNPDAVAPDLDKAIEKVSVVVNLHRVSHWTDDCYLLLGKAQYLKQDYESAEETFRYLVSEFSPEKMAAKEKKSKKKKGNGKRDEREVSSDDGEEDVDISQLSEKEQRRLMRQQEKERKRYNRQLKKQRKKEQRARKKARKKARKRRKRGQKVELPSPELEQSNQEEAENATASEEDETPEEETEADDEEEEMISISDEEEAADEPAPQPDNYFLKHRPVYQEGVLWLARTYTERGMYDRAMRLILQLEADSKTFDDIREELAVVKAHHFLRQEKYELALEPLEEAIASAGKRQDKARYAFIIAQLHQRAGRRGEALAAFERALKYGPGYDMEFSSRLYIVENGWRSGAIATEEARDRLDKMLKDSKNYEYQDQIYYTLAEIELESGNRREGIALLEKSLSNSTQNELQKAESYLRLANLYLDEEDFVPAQKYFDSTLTVLPRTDERYPEVERWRNNLTDIAANLETIALQDSLLQIAALSEEEKRELAYAIKKKRDEERLQRIANKAAASGNQGLSNSAPPGRSVSLNPGSGRIGNQESNFFAYDDRAVRRGKKEFFRQWGDRPLEDNWRRSNKQGGDLPVANGETEAPAEVLPEDEINQILADVPGSDSEILEAQLKMQEAMYKLGTLYRDRLGNHRKSIEALEEMNRRFERSSYQLDSWYYLYLDYKDIGNQQQAEAYADRILEKFPTSTYAKVISNPNYAQELAEEENKLNRFYNEAYAAFTSGNYQVAYRKSLEAPRVFGAQNAMQPKFALLTAMAMGNLQGKEAYVGALQDLIARYPDTPEQKRAREILRLLGAGSSGLPGGAQAANTQFEVNDDQLHYILIVFNEDISLNESKVKVSNYHLEYHRQDRLRVTNIYLGTDAETRLPILVVRRFKDKTEAMNYYNGIQRNQQDFIDPSVDYQIYAVSQNNYREILRSKSLNGYGNFFAQYYLQ